MSVEYFTEKNLVPDDGSQKIIDILNKNVDFSNTSIYIYPDVHYKKGARIVNGILIASDKYIYPACLGVENCGFTFGKIKSNSIINLQKSFEDYSKILKDYSASEAYSEKYIDNLFREYIENDFNKNKTFYDFLNIKSAQRAYIMARKTLKRIIMLSAKKTLGSLGGGNHFFEIHRIIETYDKIQDFKENDLIFILHSDSISVGDILNLTFSNLSELDVSKKTSGYLKRYLKFRLWQLYYFIKNGDLFSATGEVIKLLFSQKDYRVINVQSSLGLHLLFDHNIASLFGDMNRDMIISNWSKTQNIEYEIFASHSHDSIRIENGKIIHRNGVQFIGESPFFMLPSAMGGFSYIMKNTFNKKSFYSANHGLGRIQDKHIARNYYTEEDTYNELEQDTIKLYRVGKGNIAEQNIRAFKDANVVIDTMKKYDLGMKMAKTKPVAIIKG